MSKLPLTVALLPYDRVQAVLSGEVTIEGVELSPRTFRWPLDIFSRMITGDELDVAEMSLTQCYVLRALGRARFVPLPVFPSRMFRHGYIFVHRGAAIRSPKDLEGRRIGLQGYQTTAVVWIRGMLQDEYGVSFSDVRWFQGGVNQPGVRGGSATSLHPEGPVRIERIGAERTLSEMLAGGEIDALINPEIPRSLYDSPDVVRLFPNYHALERDYFRRTGIFPIMHALVLREELHRQHPWLAGRICQAFEQAKALALRQARYSGALAYMLPWMQEEIEEIGEVFGDDPWPYGLEANRAALETFGRYLTEQGLLQPPVSVDGIFAKVANSGGR